MQYSQIISVSWLLLGLSAASCASSDPAPAPPPMNCTTFDYSKYTVGTMARTSADVLAIVNNATTCGTVACHQNPINPPAIAGPNVTAASLSAALVNVASPEVPMLKYVMPGDPHNSYMMRKLDETNPGCGLACTDPAMYAGGCMTRMPNGGVPLPADQLNTIRDWILQGAH